MKNLLIRGNGSKPIQIVKGGTNSLYGLLSASQGQALFSSVSRKGFRFYFQGTSSAARGLVKCRDLQLSPSFASSSSHSGLPLSDILTLTGVSGVEFPFPSLIKYQFRSLLVIQYVIPSGIDVGGFRGSLNAATGTHEFGLGSVKEIIEAPVESGSVWGFLSTNLLMEWHS